jgi:hypothetical protein
MVMPKPLKTAVDQLLELKVIEVKKGEYVYSSEFEKTADELKKHPPGIFESTKLAKDIEMQCAPVLLAYVQYFKSQRDIKLLATAYVLLVKHLKRLNIKNTLEMSVIYGAYYFNNHTFSVNELQ